MTTVYNFACAGGGLLGRPRNLSNRLLHGNATESTRITTLGLFVVFIKTRRISWQLCLAGAVTVVFFVALRMLRVT